MFMRCAGDGGAVVECVRRVFVRAQVEERC